MFLSLLFSVVLYFPLNWKVHLPWLFLPAFSLYFHFHPASPGHFQYCGEAGSLMKYLLLGNGCSWCGFVTLNLPLPQGLPAFSCMVGVLINFMAIFTSHLFWEQYESMEIANPSSYSIVSRYFSFLKVLEHTSSTFTF